MFIRAQSQSSLYKWNKKGKIGAHEGYFSLKENSVPIKYFFYHGDHTNFKLRFQVNPGYSRASLFFLDKIKINSRIFPGQMTL